MFRIPDLRNKILFTLFIIAVYRFGANIIAPGIDFNAVQSLASAANKGGVIAYLNLFSGGALTKFAVFGLGIMPYITSSIIIQLLMVVIPKFEQWREEGPSGQKKLTQVTRYLTIALAIMQSTGPGLRLPQRRRRPARRRTPLNIDLIPDFTVPRVLLIVLTMTAGTVVVMWLGELITQRGIGQGMSVLIFTNVVSGLPSQGDALLKSAGWPKFSFIVALALVLLGGHRVHRAGPAADTGHLRQEGGGPAHVRRPEHLHTDEGQHRWCGADHLRRFRAVLPDPHLQRLPEHGLGQGRPDLDQHAPGPAEQPGTSSCTAS